MKKSPSGRFSVRTAYGIRTHDFQDENLASWTGLDERGICYFLVNK